MYHVTVAELNYDIVHGMKTAVVVRSAEAVIESFDREKLLQHFHDYFPIPENLESEGEIELRTEPGIAFTYTFTSIHWIK